MRGNTNQIDWVVESIDRACYFNLGLQSWVDERKMWGTNKLLRYIGTVVLDHRRIGPKRESLYIDERRLNSCVFQRKILCAKEYKRNLLNYLRTRKNVLFSVERTLVRERARTLVHFWRAIFPRVRKKNKRNFATEIWVRKNTRRLFTATSKIALKSMVNNRKPSISIVWFLGID